MNGKIHNVVGRLSFACLATLVFVCASMCAGCGGSKLQKAFRTHGGLRAAQAGVVRVLEAGLEADLEERCAGLVAAEREACAMARAAERETAERALDATGETVDGLELALLQWAERVLAGEADEDNPPLRVCESLAQATDIIAAWGELANEDFPLEVWECGQ